MNYQRDLRNTVMVTSRTSKRVHLIPRFHNRSLTYCGARAKWVTMICPLEPIHPGFQVCPKCLNGWLEPHNDHFPYHADPTNEGVQEWRKANRQKMRGIEMPEGD